jgi:hypothetical protein
MAGPEKYEAVDWVRVVDSRPTDSLLPTPLPYEHVAVRLSEYGRVLYGQVVFVSGERELSTGHEFELWNGKTP